MDPYKFDALVGGAADVQVVLQHRLGPKVRREPRVVGEKAQEQGGGRSGGQDGANFGEAEARHAYEGGGADVM